MSEEEILEIIRTRLTLEVARWREGREATFTVMLKLDGEIISSDSFSALI